jgi:trehalose 6-phosphate phosphatase
MARTLADLVTTLAADPRHGAVVCDIDGTLAPIAPTPEQATVLPAALPELERLVGRYTLVACVTGRPAAQARRMVPIPGVAISGNHGLEVMHGDDVTVVPQAARYMDAVHEALLVVENDGLLPELGCRVEDKGITFTVHFRGSPRPDHALRYLEAQIVPKLDRAGLAWSFRRWRLTRDRRCGGCAGASGSRTCCTWETTVPTWTRSARPRSRSRSVRPKGHRS